MIEYLFGQNGVWYLVGLGAAAIIFAVFLPRGLWGTIEDKFRIRLLPIGYTLRLLNSNFDVIQQGAQKQAAKTAEPSPPRRHGMT
jgi:branched-chain amino acid transport system permease protein